MTLYPCCPNDDEQPCPQAETGHDLPCNGPVCSLSGKAQSPLPPGEGSAT